MHGWHIDAICEHLEAVTSGEITRLLINVPPGCMKSLILNVFWPAWEWATAPHLRYVATAHNQALAIRDSTKMRRLIASDWYQKRWGDRVKLTGDQASKIKFENTATGFREAVAFESLTGVRGDRVLIDDPHSVDSAESEAERENVTRTFLEAIPTRLNNPDRSAIVVIMQRLHEADVSGVILEKGLGYEHLCLPMRFDESRRCETGIGFVDPRTEEGELLFPERFPLHVVERDERAMGPYAVAGQFQQTPTPRGGGILRRDDWRLWDDEEAAKHGARSGAFPTLELVVASLDPAYTEKEENDPSGFTIWGLWRDREGIPRLILMNAWAKRLMLHGGEFERLPGEDETRFRRRCSKDWGLVEWVAHDCRRFRADMLLVESKASGISVGQELRRLCKQDDFGVRLVNPGNKDKVARAYAVQPSFANGKIYAPDRDWADKVITQCESFPKGAHDDLVDSTTQAVGWFREAGLLETGAEIQAAFTQAAMHKGRPKLVYEA